MAVRRGERRGLLRGLAGVAVLGAAGSAGALALRRSQAEDYTEVLANCRGPAAPGTPPPLALVHHAVMAANSHNTQPWRFAVTAQAIEIRPDSTRRTPAVDPDDHHLHASLGCALENLVQAASAHGVMATAEVAADGTARALLEAAPVSPGPLFQAIPRRQSTRAAFDGGRLGPAELRALSVARPEDGVEVLLIDDPARRETLLDLVVAGNAAQLRDAAFVAELLGWIRFSHAEAVATRDGLFTGASGNPVVPGALGRRLFRQVFTLEGETDRYVRQIRSSAGLAVFVADADRPEGWVRAGRCAQRFCLQATALGLRTAWVNQPVEVPGLRGALAAWLGVAPLRPNLILRFGRGPELPASLRRPVAAVLEADYIAAP
ncbi:Acg family FMN-binding oxidoreductase [Falsiroseomonas selenitidurans]|uniref:Tat pathway signal protein n=1 Tax=Falsiroseomonas selenitidurans TaxID=2716335 RepID=A0ABX1EA00_9PROT|nr:nitroreductase family protein [Falsiroseomonas selenitidurans]NKC33658.1 Tat pathway signal protein [Falsiroseomonas selenitidurans]